MDAGDFHVGARAVGVPGVGGLDELMKLLGGGAGGLEVEDQESRVGWRGREAGTGATPGVAVEEGARGAVGGEGGEFNQNNVIAGGVGVGAGGAARVESRAEAGAEGFVAETAGGVIRQNEAGAGGEATSLGEGEGGAGDGDGRGDIGGGGVGTGRGQAGEEGGVVEVEVRLRGEMEQRGGRGRAVGEAELGAGERGIGGVIVELPDEAAGVAGDGAASFVDDTGAGERVVEEPGEKGEVVGVGEFQSGAAGGGLVGAQDGGEAGGGGLQGEGEVFGGAE